MTEIPEEAVDVLMDAIIATPREFHTERVNRANRVRFRAALAAALPHLRVQETRPASELPPESVTVHLTGPGAQFVSGTSFPSGATYEHVHSNGPDAADCTTCEPPHPRPVVDREALAAELREHEFKAVGSPGLEAFFCRCMVEFPEPGPDGYYGGPFSQHLADAVLALLPTEEETKALVETGTKLGEAIGRKAAGEEIAAALLRFEADDIRGRADMSIERAAEIARSIGSLPSGGPSEPLTASTGHSDLPEGTEGLQEPCGCILGPEHTKADHADLTKGGQ